MYIEPASYSVLAFSSKTAVGLPVGLFAPFFTLLGLGYVLYNLTTDSVASTGSLIEVIDRGLHLWLSGYDYHHNLKEFLFTINRNLNHHSYSELTSIYDALNQLYVEINGYINHLDSLAEASLSVRDNGTSSKRWVDLADLFRNDLKGITELLQKVEPRIDVYRFFSELNF